MRIHISAQSVNVAALPGFRQTLAHSTDSGAESCV